MEQIAKQLTDKWKEIIESTSVRGYKRKIESVDFFKMDKYYPGYPDVICYKVVFNFEDGVSYSNVDKGIDNPNNKEWNKELEYKFTKMFWEPATDVMPKPGTKTYATGEVKFENSRVDYMTNQGYRFIIQFYPEGFIPELRDEKLSELGII